MSPNMSAVTDRPTDVTTDVTPREPIVALKRRTIDSVLIGVGIVFALCLFVAGGLLSWGAGFADDYVGDELSSQNITFPPAEALEAEGRTDLLQYAGEGVSTGPQAEAYAWSTVGTIAGYAAIAAFAAGALMVILVALGFRHHHKVATVNS